MKIYQAYSGIRSSKSYNGFILSSKGVVTDGCTCCIVGTPDVFIFFDVECKKIYLVKCGKIKETCGEYQAIEVTTGFLYRICNQERERVHAFTDTLGISKVRVITDEECITIPIIGKFLSFSQFSDFRFDVNCIDEYIKLKVGCINKFSSKTLIYHSLIEECNSREVILVSYIIIRIGCCEVGPPVPGLNGKDGENGQAIQGPAGNDGNPGVDGVDGNPGLPSLPGLPGPIFIPLPAGAGRIIARARMIGSYSGTPSSSNTVAFGQTLVIRYNTPEYIDNIMADTQGGEGGAFRVQIPGNYIVSANVRVSIGHLDPSDFNSIDFSMVNGTTIIASQSMSIFHPSTDLYVEGSTAYNNLVNGIYSYSMSISTQQHFENGTILYCSISNKTNRAVEILDYPTTNFAIDYLYPAPEDDVSSYL